MCNLYRLRTTHAEAAAYFQDLRRLAAIPQSTRINCARKAGNGRARSRRTADLVRDAVGLSDLSIAQTAGEIGPASNAARMVEHARYLCKPMWKGSVLTPAQRCLVPFTQFSEPKDAAARAYLRDDKWWFAVTDQTLPCFAGMWKEDTTHGRVFAFCTTEPNPLVKPKHSKAMPMILLAEDHDRWLRGSYDDAVELQAAYPSQLMSVEGI